MSVVGESPSFTVSEFVAVFNQSLEMMYPQVAVVGEISNFRVSKGKWVYFDLKDEFSSVRFFGSAFRLPGPLEDGITCEVFGQPRLHQQLGFSINFDTIRPVGEGSLKKARDLLARKLEAEGLFAPDRKRPIPYPPQRIGLITSAESAAIADFKKIINARWPLLKIELTDTLVQGASAPVAVVKALQDFNMHSEPPEVLVIIRGGGSAGDLAAFSEESVVRAVAASRIPTLVAIGHENDISLAELAADRRASTPSNAAELLVPDKKHELQSVKVAAKSLGDLVAGIIKNAKTLAIEDKKTLVGLLEAVFISQRHDIANKRVLLNALDPLQPLKQGYALVRSAAGKHVKKAAQLKGSEVFSVQFSDGKKQIRVYGKE